MIVSASIDENLPAWLSGKGHGWITAEYGMLPRATHTRNRRSSGSPAGRSVEIQRLIGRSIRAVSNLNILGSRSVYLDCDVIGADGGTRVASIIGASVAMHDAGSWLVDKGLAARHPMNALAGAVSIVLTNGEILVDPSYEEDSNADVDMNVVMDEAGNLIEIQGAAEKSPFSRDFLETMIDTASDSIGAIIAIQKSELGLI